MDATKDVPWTNAAESDKALSFFGTPAQAQRTRADIQSAGASSFAYALPPTII
jgi:hypothetical protein